MLFRGNVLWNFSIAFMSSCLQFLNQETQGTEISFLCYLLLTAVLKYNLVQRLHALDTFI